MKKLICMTSVLLAGCAGIAQTDEGGDYAQQMLQLFKQDFKSRGPTSVERLTNPDEVQKLCSTAQASNAQAASALEQSQLATIKFPSTPPSTWLGEWKRGEVIAQNGRGMQSSDAVGGVNGGNCYACHQISKTEISFGNIGPSLYQYGKLRGQSEEVLRYTWGKIYNPQAYRACSVMPRFGHHAILTEAQIKDLMALLFDPTSPANQ